MSKKKQLQDELERANNLIEALKNENETLKKQRTALVNQIGECEALTKARDDVYLTLAGNITKSLKSKNIINMSETERNDLYFMLSQFDNLSKSTDIEARQALMLHRANLV